MKVEILNSPEPNCDEFVRNMPNAKICHTYQWGDATAKASHLKSFYLVARDADRIHGVLPLTQSKSRLFGNIMVSQAFSDYGGILADSDNARDALFNYAVELATANNCQTIEFRNIQPLPFNLDRK